MYYDDHAPPHFQPYYAEHEAVIALETGDVVEGRLPKHAARMVKEWTLYRRDGLKRNWERAQSGKPLERLAGLDAD